MPPASSSSSGDGVNKSRSQPANDRRSTHGPAACMDCRNRKVKCNRELPKCSNCKKSGVPCIFPNPEKKSSQMKQLSEDVAAFNVRLSGIEKSIIDRMQDLTELVTQSMRERPAGTTAAAHHANGAFTLKSPLARTPEFDDSGFDDNDDNDYNDDDNDDNDDEDDDDEMVDCIGRRNSCNGSSDSFRHTSIVVNDGPTERFYGPCSTYAHMVHSRRLVEKLLDAGKRPGSARMSRRSSSHASNRSDPQACIAQGTPVFAEVQRKYDSFTGVSNFKENFEMGDDKPLELPPRRVLEEAIDMCTSESSLELPLFNKQALLDAVAEQYSINASEVDESWVLCFTNIILRSSSWKSRAFRFNSFAAGGVDDNTLQLLLSNANRALRQLERFCGARLVNVQALFLLALAGRDLIHYNVFERIFDRVCQLAKQMGLHERGVVAENSTPEEREAQNVLWNIYSADKQRIFVRGPPCRIYRFECDIEFPAAETDRQRLVSADLRLNCLTEEVYRHLYSPKAAKLDAVTRQQRVNRLDSRLSVLARQVEAIASSADHGSVECNMGLQLKYAFYVTKLIIHSRSTAAQSKQMRLETARSALQTIRTLSESGPVLNGGLVVLERLFCNYSVIAFHEVFENLIVDGNSTSTNDLELLIFTTKTLRLLTYPDRPYAYCTRLHKNFTWCTEIASLIQNARKSSASNSHRSSISSVRNGGQMAQSYMDHLQQRGTPSPHFSSNRLTPQDFDNSSDDVFMDDGAHSASGLSSAALSSIDSGLDLNEFGRFHNSFATPDLFAGGDFGAKGNLMSNQFATPIEAAVDNSAQFQEALKYMFDTGAGSDATFHQNMLGRGASHSQNGRGVWIAD